MANQKKDDYGCIWVAFSKDIKKYSNESLHHKNDCKLYLQIKEPAKRL